MDINSLLSPQNSPDGAPTTTTTATTTVAVGGTNINPHTLARTPSSLTLTQPASSAERSSSLPSGLPHAAVTRPRPGIPSPSASGLSSDGPRTTLGPGTGTPSSEGQARQASTPGMDALADLASMQHHHQIARAKATGPRSADVLEAQQRPIAQAYANVQALARNRSSPLSTLDHSVAGPTPAAAAPPRTYAASSLTEAELATIASLVSELTENPYLYASHVKLIALLRQGLTAHVDPPSESAPRGDPHTYELLQDLHDARETMVSRFPLTEDLWADWIADEILMARTVEERVAVIELCQRAVAEAVGSVKVWLAYGNWVFRLFHAARPGLLDDLAAKHIWDGDVEWTDDERAVGAEIFGWETMLDVWKQGVRATQWRMHESHLIWDRYAELIVEDLANGPNHEKVSRVKALFDERLRVPHATWDQTFQVYSTFVTNYDDASYEDSMVSMNRRAADAKAKYASRERFELRLKAATDAHDELAEWTALAEYLEWEVAQVRKKDGSHHLCNALFERAVLRFGTDANLWEDYVFFVIDSTNARSASVSPLAVLHRATRHCPWSGSLWAQYLLSSEREERPFHEVEEVKHKATSTGLMDIGGVDEVIKAYTAWCGYLNRRAFHDQATDEEADVAEVGIRSAIEIVKELGEKKYGKDYAGDPNYRLQRIYVEYLSRSGLWDRARTEVWKSLVPSRGDSYEFWLRWYHWEMMYWYTLGSTAGGRKSMPTPTTATSVLRQAVTRQGLDWPEKILEVYMDHVRDSESIEALQVAVVLVRKISKGVAKRRQREAEQAALQQQQQQQQATVTTTAADEPTSTGKRKRDTEAGEATGHTPKKSRHDTQSDTASPPIIPQASTTSLLKRDRENTTIIVRKIPMGVSETKVRQFFRDCGQINSLKLLPEPDGEFVTATIEFESAEDVLAAQTRDMKMLEGSSIEVQVGTRTTIFVTNFRRTADESTIRDLFREYGEIVDVRFPSLKYNTHRRFCYVQFKSSEQAQRATQLDGTNGGGDYALVVKISDPTNKQGRTGPLYEGREIYVSQLDWSATEDELRGIFSKYGTVERVRIPTNVAGKSKGIAFVVFSTKDEAEAALEMNLTKFKSRILNVSLSTANPAKRQATTIIRHSESNSMSPSPPPSESPRQQSTSQQGDHIRPNAADDKDGGHHRPSRESLQSRTVALLNIPDTVNDARIRDLMEPYGLLVRVVLRPDHQGAMVEYADVKDAGRAALGIEGHEIVPGRKIRVGTVKEMLDQKAEVRRDKLERLSMSTTKKKKMKDEQEMKRGGVGAWSGIIRRPGHQVAGTKRRGGGLGVKRGGNGTRGGGGAPTTTTSSSGTTSTARHDVTTDSTTTTTAATAVPDSMTKNPTNTIANSGMVVDPPKPKTNADFKKLFLKTKEESAEAAGA